MSRESCSLPTARSPPAIHWSNTASEVSYVKRPGPSAPYKPLQNFLKILLAPPATLMSNSDPGHSLMKVLFPLD